MIRTHALRLLTAAASFFLTTGIAYAELPAATSSPAPEIVHTVTTDRSETTLRNATRTTYVVTREAIERNGYRTVGDALTSVPGVEIEHYGTVGENVSYGIRGSSSAQVLVLIDGLPAAGTLSNSVQFGTISTAGVERIEVVEGGGSTLYGSGAIGGIINIITDSSHAAPYARAALGTFNDRELLASTHGFSLERIVSDNAFALPPSATPGNPAVRDNSAYRTTTLRYAVDGHAFNGAANVRLSAESDHLGAAGMFPYYSATSVEDDVNLNGAATLTHVTANARRTIQLGGERQRIAFGCDLATDTNCYQSQTSISTESRVFFNMRNVVTHEQSRTIFGADLSRGFVRSDDGNGDLAFNVLSQTAAYAQQTYIHGNTSWYAGLRGERDGSLGGEFSPSIGVRTELQPGVLLRVNAATAFRAPNASELYFPGYGVATLRPERAVVGDASIEDTTLLGGARLSWFTNNSRDLIVAVPDISGMYHPQNVATALLQGVTLDVATRPSHGVTTGLTLTDLYAARNRLTGSRLPNDPVFATSLHLDVAANRHSSFAGAGVAFNAQGSRTPGFDPTQPLFYQSGPYATVDAYARMRVAGNAVLTIRGLNLGNERYAQVSGYPMPGRSMLVELSTRP